MSFSFRCAPVVLLLPLAAGCSAESGAPAWGVTSTRIELSSFGYWEGSSRFEADRAQLNGAQLAALDGLRSIPTPRGHEGEDFVSYRVQIADLDGTVATYRAAQDNIIDGDESDPTLRTLDVDTLEPFLETFDCLTASQTRNSLVEAPDLGADGNAPGGAADANRTPTPGVPRAPANWSDAPAVSTAVPGCFHGVFVPSACRDVWLELAVEAPGSYELRAEDCFETLEIALFSADGSTELASASGTGPACPVLSRAFAEAGTYPLVLRKTNGAGCSAPGSAGDFFFRVVPGSTP